MSQQSPGSSAPEQKLKCYESFAMRLRRVPSLSNNDLSEHIKKHQNCIYCLKKNIYIYIHTRGVTLHNYDGVHTLVLTSRSSMISVQQGENVFKLILFIYIYIYIYIYKYLFQSEQKIENFLLKISNLFLWLSGRALR